MYGRKDVPIIKGGEREGAQVHLKTIEKRVYKTLEVVSNGTNVFHREEK